MDKKIGIMSMQRIINYGSFLQAYGLKKMIESVSKSEVEFIDYRFGVDITNRLKKPQSKAESIVDKILKNRTPWNYLKKKNFFKEIERNLILDLKDIGVDKLNYDCEVDTLVIGSDEVFNCLQPYPVGYSKQLFGDGYAHSKIVSYAASFGSTRYEDLVDDGYTGSNFDRPGFQKMMDGVRSGEIDTIIVKDLSRFGRDYIGVGEYMEQIFPLLGVRLISVNDNYDSNNYNGATLGMDLVVSNLVNTMYCRDLSIGFMTMILASW